MEAIALIGSFGFLFSVALLWVGIGIMSSHVASLKGHSGSPVVSSRPTIWPDRSVRCDRVAGQEGGELFGKIEPENRSALGNGSQGAI